jgi:hypothetical protein
MWAWLQRWWKWLALTVALVGAFLAGLLLRRKPTIIVSDDGTKKKAEDETKAQDDAAQKKHDQDVKAAEETHDQGVMGELEAEKKKAEELKDDPEGTNAYLKKIGEDVRK